jgi:DNA polymerase I-like protein with 3'-5' exonuclease and polymerase domains/uracil-DNA glycosylase
MKAKATSLLPGADCASCPLRARNRTACEHGGPRTSKLAIVGRAPDFDDARNQLQWSGRKAKSFLAGVSAKASNERPLLTNLIACPVPAGFGRENFAKAAAACRGRLERELGQLSPDAVIVTAGIDALQQLASPNERVTTAIDDWLGAPVVSRLPGIKGIVPLLDVRDVQPGKRLAYAYANKVWTAKAVRYQRDALEWVWPEIHLFVEHADDEEAVINALDRMNKSPRLGLDIETPKYKAHHYRALHLVPTYDISLADLDSKLAVDINPRVATPRVWAKLLEVLSTHRTWDLHNGISDFRKLAADGIRVVGEFFDTMQAFTTVFYGIKKGLATAAALLTDAPRWKDEFKADSRIEVQYNGDVFASADPRKRGIYCGRDSYVQTFIARIIESMLDKMPNGRAIFEARMQATRLAMKMTKRGITCNDAKRVAIAIPLEAKVDELRAAACAVVARIGYVPMKKKTSTRKGVKSFTLVPTEWNPASPQHIDGVFRHLGIEPMKVNRETGASVWDKKVLNALLVHDSELVRDVAFAVLEYKQYSKQLSTYVKNTKMADDGRIHPTWKAMHAISLRWGCEKDNESNIPKSLRKSRIARPGHVLVRADWKGQELRIIAQVAKVQALLDTFERGGDVHDENTIAMFGGTKDTIDPILRLCMKIVQFSMNYGAGFDTIYGTMMLRKELRSMPKKMARKIYDGMLERLHEITVWWGETKQQAIKTGKIQVPGSLLWIPTWGHFDLNLHTNIQIQGRGAQMQHDSLMHIAKCFGIDVHDEELTQDFVSVYSHPMILANQHDACELEVPEHLLDFAIEVVREAMVKPWTYNDITMQYPVDIEVGYSYGSGGMVSLDKWRKGERP